MRHNINLPHAGCLNKFLTLDKFITSVPVWLCGMARFSLIFLFAFYVIGNVFFFECQESIEDQTTSHNKTNEVAPKHIPNSPISNQEDAETWSSDQNEVLVVYNILLV